MEDDRIQIDVNLSNLIQIAPKYIQSEIYIYTNRQFISILKSQVVECSMGSFIHKDSRS